MKIYNLGRIIKEYREKNNISQREFAFACSLSNGYISMLENERNPKTEEPIVPSITTLKNLAKAMGLTLNELLSKVNDVENIAEVCMPDRSKTISMKMASQIRLLRLTKKMTQKELATRLYKSESTVRMWELGRSEPDAETLVMLANILGASTDFILGRNAPEHNTHTPEEIGQLVRNLRGSMSLRDFAKKCNVSHTTIDTIEKGYDFRTGKAAKVKLDTLQKIAKACNVPISFFAERNSDEKMPEDIVVFRYDGKEDIRRITRTQRAVLMALLDAIPENI